MATDVERAQRGRESEVGTAAGKETWRGVSERGGTEGQTGEGERRK